MISCYGTLGAISGIKYPDSTVLYLNKAIELAQHFDPPRQYTYKSKLAGLIYYHDQDYPRANRLAMDVFKNGSEDCLEYQFYYYATMTYLKMGLIDSAKYMLANTPPPIDAVDSMNWYNAVAEIAKAEDNHISYGENAVKSSDLTSDILAESKEKQLVEAEQVFNMQQIVKKEQAIKSRSHTLSVTLAVLAILLVLLIGFLHRRLKLKEKERQFMEQELKATITSLRERLKQQMDSNNSNISALVKCRLEAFQELFDSIRFKAKREENSKKRSIVTLRGVLSGIGEHYQLMNVHMGDSFWEKLRTSVDGEFNGIISFVEQRYPTLTPRDIRIFCLLCTNVSPQIIKICMNLTNVKTVSNYRGNIMGKIGLDMTFDEFILKYLNGDLN